MATAYAEAYVSTTAISGAGGPRAYAQAGSSGDSVTGGVLVAYDNTLTPDQLRAALRKVAQFISGLPV